LENKKSRAIARQIQFLFSTQFAHKLFHGKYPVDQISVRTNGIERLLFGIMAARTSKTAAYAEIMLITGFRGTLGVITVFSF
jgi:hypothetical protein